jgi:hypothetical protein
MAKRPVAADGWSRRDLLAGAATIVPAGALATLPALAVEADHADAALFALEPAFNEVNERWRASMDERAEAEDRYCEAKPPMPEDQDMPEEVNRALGTLTLGTIRKLPDWHPVRVWFNEGDAARKAWAAECDRLRIETGLSDAESVEYDLRQAPPLTPGKPALIYAGAGFCTPRLNTALSKIC